jgi:hypothetical protein
VNPHEVNQLARDIAAIINAYVGPAGEIVVDTDSWTIRLQDNSTAGGHIFAPMEINDARYQSKDAFLNSLIGLKNVPGFVYVSGSAVGTRAFAFSDQFTIAPGTLATDDFGVTLNLSQAGNWSFTQVTAGQLIGPLSGNTTGTHIGPVTGNLTGNVTGNLTGNSTGNHVGAVDLRGAALQLDPEQIPNAALSAAMQALLVSVNRMPPQWSILLWDSSRATPAGWQDCDGTNGSVDMRGFFPVGMNSADSDFIAGASGGSKQHTHGAIASASSGSHAHDITVNGTSLTIAQMPAHSHSWTLGNSDSNAGLSANGSSAGPSASSTSQGSGDPHDHTATSDTHAGHTHSTTIPAITAMPPFKVLKFIQRIAA